MKKYLLSLVSFMLVCFAASAETYYRIDASKVISADATALDGITAVVTDVAGEKTWVSFSGGDGQDINANCTTVHDWSSNSEYSSIKFFAVEGQADDVYYIKFVNAEGAFYVPKGGWHDKSGCMNVTGNGGGLFVGGLNGQNGQDAANGALWKVAKTAEGYTLYNIGKERYAVPGIGVTTTETSVVLYSEFESVTYNPEAEGDYTGRIVNNKVNGADGWTCERPVGGNGPLLNGTAFEYWAGNASSRTDASFKYYQTIAGLPAGKYVLGAEMYNSSNGEGEGHEPNGNAGLYIANGESESFVGVTEDGTALKAYTTQEIEVNEGDEITVGVKSIDYMSARWFVADNFTLHRTGDLPKRKLENADFAEGVVGDVNIATYAKDGEVNQMQPVPGWEFGVENGDARAAGVVAYGSGTTLGGADYKAPAAGPEGTNGNALAVVGVWTGTVKYVQDVTLPAGKYTMTVPVYNTAGTTAFVKNLIGVKYGETEVLASTKFYPVNKWTDETVVFELAEETNVTVSLGYEGANTGSPASQHLFYDCVKIETYDEVAVAKAAAIAALPVGDESIFTPNVEDVEAVKAAIEAATTVEEVETAAATELAIPALSGEWQIKNTNGEVYLGEAMLTATAISTTFEKAEGGFYINVSGKYVNFVGTGNNKWSMGVSETASTVWNFNLADGKYTIQGPNGLIGSDDLNDGSATYCDKKTTATDKNIFWTVEEYVTPAGGWDGTISTNLEEKVLKDRDDIEGMTITFNGAKTIEIDEDGYLALAENEDGWPLLKVWATMFGSTYSIDGETITLNGWVNYEDVAADPGNMDPQTLLAKVKKVAKAPAADSWYVQDYGAFIIDGVAADEYGYLDDIAVKHEEQGGWDGTVTTSLDEATITSIADFKNMTITLNGAKSIAILDEEECAYMSLQNEDGSELYGIWGPTMGSTYTIEGNTITIGGFMPWEGATIDIPVGTTKLYIEDYGTLAIDGEGEYLPTMELNANITGPAEPFAFEVINNNVKVKNNSSEEAETVSIRFQIDSEYDVAVGEGVPTLTANGEEQGEATLSVVDGIGLITFNAAPAAKDGEFTAAGTYTLIIPEGTFVDANGAPNELFGASWVILEKVPVLADGDYYIQENTSGLYLSNGAYWGTRSVLSDNGICYKAVLGESGKYTLKSGIKGDAKALRPSDGFNDQSGEWEIIAAENGGVYMFNGTKYFTRVEGSAIPDFTENKDEASVWNFITPEERMATLAEGTAENPVDATFLIKGADFLNGDIANNAWSKNKVGGDNGSGNTLINNTNCEQWNAGAVDVNQTLTNIPNGIYQLKAFGYVRQNGATTASADAYENGEETPAYLYANEAQTQLKSIFAEAYTETKPSFATVTSTAGNTYYIANGQNTAAVCFEDGRYLTETIEVEVTDGTLKIGVKCDGVEWLVFDNFRLTYLGEPPFYTDVVVWPTLDQVNVHFNAQTAEPTYEAPVNLETADGELVEENITVKLGAEFGDVKFCFSKPLEYGDYVIVINPGSMTFMYSHEGCAEEIRIPFTIDEEATGINEINVNTVNQIYTLSGVRVNKAQKGIYIINGKKVVIK